MKTEINKWILIKLKKFYTAKATINKVKRQSSEWEKIIANQTTDKGLIYKIYKQLIQLISENQTTQSKSRKNTYVDISPKKIYRWLTNTWKDAQHYSLREKCKSKTTMRYHLTPVRMANIKKSTNNKCWRGCGEMGTLLHYWWECKLIQPQWRSVDTP